MAHGQERVGPGLGLGHRAPFVAMTHEPWALSEELCATKHQASITKGQAFASLMSSGSKRVVFAVASDVFSEKHIINT